MLILNYKHPLANHCQILQRTKSACSAIVNAKHHAKNNFHGLDAYLERKQMKKFSTYLAFENYSDNKIHNEESYFEYRIPNVLNCTDTRLHSDDDYLNSSVFNTQNEGKLKLLSG